MIVGYDLLLDIIEYVGPLALFLVLCLGLIGLPIPNEAVALTGGALAESGILQGGLAYLMLSLGICSAMTFNYSLGRFTSSKLGKWFTSKQKLGAFAEKSQQLIEKYGIYAIPISVFFPFLRHATPYIMGINRLRFSRFALIGFPTAAIWTAIYFTIGHFVGDKIPELIKVINRYEVAFYIVAACAIVLLALWYVRKQRLKRIAEHQDQQQYHI
nr:DedA family protein [Paenibacillus camelliae]